ncbi:FG-GAP-like repeat-containing protein [Streptomyces sp. NBC_00572]|uniref:FG-GAP-like repeat-containing protein n=1 Tax=Streptomyces sp. NBC_00572 TaxID=2903664 RepID=UPI002254A80E|nr:FG-GAP-like repeat-containing protein [Streptomyces sp. NBC_00572]MCX4982642.1 FG-GAP-like repeat-containing protein [Streptomyces sp. NBC_00572]
MRTSLLRRLATVATALGLSSAGLLGAGAAPAQAAISDCPSGYFCAWKTDNGTGTMYKTNTSVATLGGWDNTFRSVVNRTNKFACLYDDANHGLEGNVGVMDPNPSGTEWGGPGSNSVSSVKFVPTERECAMDPYPVWHAGEATKAAGFGDLNADRTSDILVRDKAGRLWFLPGNGTGKLVGAGGWNVMNALTRHGDFTGDAREDVIARETATGKLWLYPGTGTGSLGARKLIGSGGWNVMNSITAFGDLSGDGRSDVLAVEKSTGKLWLYPGTSTGTLGARKLIGAGGWNVMNTLAAPGDMNGDGKADLIAREAATGKLWLYPGKTGALGARVLIGAGGWNVMASLLAVGDFEGDGHNDLAAISGSSYSSNVFRGEGALVLYSGTGTGKLEAGFPETDSWWNLNGAF